jgi:Fe2+ or Zn2+ uptake regulation protein
MGKRGDRHTLASVQSICDVCETVEESVAPGLRDELSSVAGKSGVRPARHVIEIHGLCASRGSGQVRA